MIYETKIREMLDQFRGLANQPSGTGNTEILRDFLKVVLNEITNPPGSGKRDKKLTEKEEEAVLRKMLKNNEEFLAVLPEDADFMRRRVLEIENHFLKDLLPTQLTKEDIIKTLEDNGVDVKSANNDGQAMGMAMKLFKQLGLSVDGSLVKEVVSEARS